jgi:histone H3/H4
MPKAKKAQKEKAPRKKVDVNGKAIVHHQTKGIKPTSAIREVKAGAHGKVRVSRLALDAIILQVEHDIKDLAKTTRDLLEMSKKKKVTKLFLLKAVKHSKKLYCQNGLKAAIETASKGESKGDRKSIAVASITRFFKKEMGEGFIVSSDSKVAISQLTERMLRNFGADAARYAETSNRHTIKKRDVKAAVEARQHL